ncbi:uncharacterized protein BT62DRAFT_798471 [Guyanagaster necrorhizus]|uniref:Uncharacterized protein n=1 Tax=Guyanagaster necrorhizus TaxID=856835 RepID=A0A9P7VEC3_9AGAR|nr:uncharacterized protein BT62DRAFT_798471 [Guyanagaster necrorhizus MCA 3950]KAG7439149.1 hypothetical protein BT62DRAFT_798471 [Guyanagaster necrorhizus MCA 3950]
MCKLQGSYFCSVIIYTVNQKSPVIARDKEADGVLHCRSLLPSASSLCRLSLLLYSSVLVVSVTNIIWYKSLWRLFKDSFSPSSLLAHLYHPACYSL